LITKPNTARKNQSIPVSFHFFYDADLLTFPTAKWLLDHEFGFMIKCTPKGGTEHANEIQRKTPKRD
jgi:hypothetical protein